MLTFDNPIKNETCKKMIQHFKTAAHLIFLSKLVQKQQQQQQNPDVYLN